jgi:hypothetical protein
VKDNLDDILRVGYHDLVEELRRTSPTDHAITELSRLIGRIQNDERQPPPRLDHWVATRYARRSEETQISTARQHPERGEVGLICDVINDIIVMLTPDGMRSEAALRLSPAGGPYLSHASHQLAQLLAGIANRTIDRDNADRMIRLAEHNIAEAVLLIRPLRDRAGKRRRRAVDSLTADAGEAARALRALHPRIMRLFDDSRDPAPLVPVSH